MPCERRGKNSPFSHCQSRIFLPAARDAYRSVLELSALHLPHILMLREQAERQGIPPQFVVRAFGMAGVDPAMMGSDPVPVWSELWREFSPSGMAGSAVSRSVSAAVRAFR
jgi:hypothetical protein